MNIYRNIDRKKIQFDFIVHTKEKCDYENEIMQLGGKIYRVEPISKHPLKNMKQIKEIISSNHYEIVHRHTNSSIIFTDLIIAKHNKVKNRYVHSHSNNTQKFKKIHKMCIPILNRVATREFACSKEAANWTFGKNGKNAEIICNGIDIERFLFNKEIRNIIRQQEKCGSKKIIGHVGRFEIAKNHEFIIELFYNLLKQDSNYELWLIGKGSLKNKIEDKVKELGIENQVRFFGDRKDVNKILQAIDIFIFPSIYEGLGISLIEAQIAGLPCVVSKEIQNEAIITDNVRKIDLKSDINVWINSITTIEINEDARLINCKDSKIQKYNIADVAKKLQDVYMNDSNEE